MRRVVLRNEAKIATPTTAEARAVVAAMFLSSVQQAVHTRPERTVRFGSGVGAHAPQSGPL